MEETVEIESVDTTPQKDGYFSTYSSLWINPSKYRCGVEQEENDNAMPIDEYLGNILTFSIDHEDGLRVDGERLEEYLTSESGQKLLLRICDGWFTEWDGQNERGCVNDDGSAAIQELLDDIGSLKSVELSTVYASEWLDGLSSDVSALTSDEALISLTDEIEEDAKEQGVVIISSVYKVLEKWRAEHIEEWVDKARDEMTNGWDEEMRISNRPFDEKTLEVTFDFSDGSRGIVQVSDNETKVVIDPYADKPA